MGPGSCLWAGGAELQALLCFPGTGEQGWLCPATAAGTLPQGCTWDLVSIKCLQQNKPGCGCSVPPCCCQGLGLGAHWHDGAWLGSRLELHCKGERRSPKPGAVGRGGEGRQSPFLPELQPSSPCHATQGAGGPFGFK